MERQQPSIPFVNLHAHDVAGSPFDALGYCPEHMDFAYQNGLTAHAITNHGNMNHLPNQVLHLKKMRAEGKEFKNVYGVEAYFIPSIEEWRVAYEEQKQTKKEATKAMSIDESEKERSDWKDLFRRRHLVLFAQNQIGLNNLFKLVSESFSAENFYRFPRIDYALLEKYGEGIIATSACLGGIYAGNYWLNRDDGDEAVLEAMRETTRRMQGIFGDRWYAEVQWNRIKEQHELNQYVIQIAEEFDIPLISTVDCHYPTPDSWKDRELYKRLGYLGRSSKPDWIEKELPQSVEEMDYELYPKNGDEVWESYKNYSQELGFEYDDELVLGSIKRTHEIVHGRVEDFIPDNTVRLPAFVVPEGKTDDQAMVEVCVSGLKEFGLQEKEEYVERLHKELDIIKERGFSKYFLTMKAIADKTNNIQLSGPGRGSAAGSLVAYVLGITQIDPIKYGLLFSRFLRKDATDYPDIDYDVSDSMALKELLIEDWGRNTVAPISNWNTLQLRSLVKDISKFYNIPFTEVNTVTGRMIKEATPLAKKKHGITAGVYSPTFEELKEYSKSLKGFLEKYPHVKTHVDAIYGQIRSCSRHAGGVVIGEDLNERMPLINSGGVIQTPWSEGQAVRHLEPMGFIKFDLLGLATLKMIEGAVAHILKRHHDIEDPTFEQVKEYYDKHLHPDVIDLNDQNVYENVFHEGMWAGVFQFTESGAQNFCRLARPTNIIELSAITSIYRPGPLSAKVDKQYVKAKGSPSDVEYEHDIIKNVTEETYGFLIFQEQIALLAHELGRDLSLDEGNKLRKLLTKKGLSGAKKNEKDRIYNKFINGCVDKGIGRGLGEELWQKFDYFNRYGFNKSHAVSYSVISFQCAWLLNYYPAEWMAAFLDKEPEKRKEKAINVAKSFGFEIQPLDVNTSGTVWEISDDGKTLIQPLTSIKGLGEAAIAQILNNRPFEDVEDFIFNEGITYSKLNKKGLDVLIRSQAMNCLMDERFAGLRHFWSAVAADRPKNRKKFNENIENYEPEGDFSDEEKIEYLSTLTGMFPLDMVLDDHSRSRLDKLQVPPISKFDPDLQLCWFIPREVTKRTSKNGRDYLVLNVIDDTSKATTVRCWNVRDNDEIKTNKPYMAKLNYDPNWGFSTYSIKKNMRLLV